MADWLITAGLLGILGHVAWTRRTEFTAATWLLYVLASLIIVAATVWR